MKERERFLRVDNEPFNDRSHLASTELTVAQTPESWRPKSPLLNHTLMTDPILPRLPPHSLYPFSFFTSHLQLHPLTFLFPRSLLIPPRSPHLPPRPPVPHPHTHTPPTPPHTHTFSRASPGVCSVRRLGRESVSFVSVSCHDSFSARRFVLQPRGHLRSCLI